MPDPPEHQSPESIIQQTNLADRLTLVSSQGQVLKGVFAGIQETSCAAKTSATQAEHVTRMVRQLNREEASILEAMKQVEEAQEIREALIGLKDATDARDHATAAGFVNQLSQYPDEMLEGPLAPFILPTGSEGGKIKERIAGARAGLSVVATREFDRAVKSADLPSIQHYFKIFPLVQETLRGIRAYGDFLSGLIAERAKSKPLQEDRHQVYAEELQELLETLALAADHHAPLVETHYGPGAMGYILQRLQEEGERLGRRILEAFEEARQPMKMIDSVDRTQKSIGSRPVRTREAARERATSVSASDVKGIDAYLSELASLSKAFHLYRGFMKSRVLAELSGLSTASGDRLVSSSTRAIQSLELEKVFDEEGYILMHGTEESSVKAKLDGLMKSYSMLDRYYLKRSLEKAFEMDSLDEPSSTTSTCVDDAFFLLKKVAFRVLSTADPNLVGVSLSMLSRMMIVDVIRPMQSRSLGEAEGYWTPNEKVKTQILGMNNLGLIGEYVKQLHERLTERVQANEAGKGRGGMWTEEEVRVLVNSLGLLDDVRKKTRTVLEIVRRRYFDQHYGPRLRSSLQKALQWVTYSMSEEAWEKYELVDGFVEVIVGEYAYITERIEGQASEENAKVLYQMTSSMIATEWEAWVMRHASRVTQLGALRLDKDLRMIMAHVSTCPAASSVREYDRLDQISTLVNVEELEDVAETASSLPEIPGGLSMVDMRKVLNLRSDWRSDEVAKVAL